MFVERIRIDREGMFTDARIQRIPALKNLEELVFEKPVTCFIGENGTGKSTLLEGIAAAAGFSPEGGSKNYRFSTYDAEPPLKVQIIRGSQREKWGWFLRAESFFNVATMEEKYAEGSAAKPKNWHRMSHGESFLDLALDSFRDRGLYLLDEPEAALSAAGQLSLLLVIHESVKNGSQFIIATHSPILTAYPDADLISFDGENTERIEYEDTEIRRINRMFVNDRENVFRRLFAEEEETDHA